jgi:AcrR family transcriptional regulator
LTKIEYGVIILQEKMNVKYKYVYNVYFWTNNAKLYKNYILEGKMKKEYRNKIRSKMLIRNSVIDLVEKKGNLSSITISEVVERANINRGTFYNHYNNVVEVIEELKDERVKMFLDELKKIASFKDFEQFINSIVKHFKENENTYRKLVRGVSRSMIDDLKIEVVKEIRRINPKIDAFNITFVANAITGMYLDYLQNRSDFSLEEIGGKIIETVKQFQLTKVFSENLQKGN